MGARRMDERDLALVPTPETPCVVAPDPHAGLDPQVRKSRLRTLAQRMLAVHVSRVGEMPRIELYLDQLLQMVGGELGFMRLPGETLVTGSMVNNYVKQRVVPAPRKHRYTRRHIASVIVVVAFKRVYSISQIRDIIASLYAAGVDMERAYNEVCAALECSLKEQFAVGTDFTVPGVEPVVHLWDAAGESVAPELARVLEAAIVSLATKVYVEQTLALDVADGEPPADKGLPER